MSDEIIKRLMDEVRTLEASEENQRRKAKWACIQKTSRDQWRGTPKFDGSAKHGNAPLQMDCNTNFWGAYLGYRVGDYYRNPEVFLQNYLKMRIARFKLFEDDVFVDKLVPIWMGSAFEASLMGMKVVYDDKNDPWIDFKYFLHEQSDLAKIPALDFYHTGQMEDAVKMYEYCRQQLDDDFDVAFPEWERGPFGVATYTRGYEAVLVDMVDADEEEDSFLREYMQFFTDRQIQFFEAREKYLGQKTGKINLYNDEVNMPTVSPGLYENYIRPYEIQLSKRFGGLNYWHSCGNLDRLYPLIAEIPGIDMIHKGPWTSAAAAGKSFGDKCAIEVCLNPLKDVIDADEKLMYDVVFGICKDLNDADSHGYTIRANNVGTLGTTDQTIEKCRAFLSCARKAIGDAAVK
ncbi:MAG: uroporphyrinogen decarboxylase family protein [Oscillospiraceae bacterium]|nr:uroporphyrinogen decarboxylase family protein [Oscillospiraceae bacterium]